MGSPEGSIMGSIPPRHLASPRARVLIYTLYIEVASPDPQIPRSPDPGHRAGGARPPDPAARPHGQGLATSPQGSHHGEGGQLARAPHSTRGRSSTCHALVRW